MNKKNYVLSQSQTRSHECHWPGCARQVPPALWGCREHWYKLPKQLRDAIWKEYRPGQEIDGKPSERYLAVAVLVQCWIDGDITITVDGKVTDNYNVYQCSRQPKESGGGYND